MKTRSSFSVLIFFVILAIGIALAYPGFNTESGKGSAMGIVIIFFLLALLVSSAIKIADQWEKAIVLRLGRFQSLRGPGIFFIIL